MIQECFHGWSMCQLQQELYFLVAKSCPTLLWPHGLQPTRLLCPWDFPGKNAGVGHHFLLQGIFLTQESNLCLLHWQVNSLPLSHQASPARMIQTGFIQSMAEKSAALTSPGSLPKRLITRPHTNVLNQNFCGWGPEVSFVISSQIPTYADI